MTTPYQLVTVTEVRRWASLYSEGMSIQCIADLHARNHKTVSKHLRRSGVTTRPTGPIPRRASLR